MTVQNILLITSDQQHWNTLGLLNPGVHTPNLDRLAAEGQLFNRTYCPNPTCTPTRSSMITGKYPSQHGAYSLGTKLPEFEQTIGDILRDAGYRTGLIGKAHFQPLTSTAEFPSLEAYPTLQDLDFWRDFDDVFYGFEHVELARNHTDEAHVGQHYAAWMEEKGLTNWRDHFSKPTGTQDPQKHTWSIPQEYHYNTWITERTCEKLRQHHDQGEKFFLWASYFDPHPSYLVPKPWDTMYDPAQVTVPHVTPGEHDNNPIHFQLTQQTNPDFSWWQDDPGGNACHGMHSHLQNRDSLAKDIAVYYSMVSYLDHCVGQLLDQLEALGMRENTLIVFTSDHGHLYGQHGLIAKGPFHYEDLIRVPFIVSLPGKVPTGQTDALFSLVDLAPSLLSALGQKIPADMTGVDQSGVWFGKQDAARENIIVENHHQPTTIHVRTYVDSRYKLTVYFNQDYGELFDLVNDPDEVHNLWSDPQIMQLRVDLLCELLRAEFKKEEILSPETAALPNKSPAMYQKAISDGKFELRYDESSDGFEMFDIYGAGGLDDLQVQESLLRGLLFERMAAEPLWMPRTGVA